MRKLSMSDLEKSLEAYVEAVILKSQDLDKKAQAELAQEFFRHVSNLQLDSNQSLEAWRRILSRRRQSSRQRRGKSALPRLVMQDLLRSARLREPVVTEYAEIQRLRASAALDPLTGLQNRRFFDDRLRNEMNASVRYAQEFTLILMDLNRFKEVNDLHGHATGDKVLTLAGGRIGETARSSDLAYRIGGDEFALLLPRTSYAGAEVVAGRLRERFAESIIPLTLEVPVSVAYGIATAPREAKSSIELFALADERLYNFKRSIGSPRCAPRAYPRIPLDKANAFAIIEWDATPHRAELVDFSIGGVGLAVRHVVEIPEEFTSQLHLPRLPPILSRVQKVYEALDPAHVRRLGCAFLDLEEEKSPDEGDQP
jgi:diguanylate cyclase (GGDEF)-like protein